MQEYCAQFQLSYYYGSNDEPILNCSDFLQYTFLYAIDCFKQNELLKTGSIDVHLHIKTTEDIPDKTGIYCLIIYDATIQYTQVSGTDKQNGYVIDFHEDANNYIF